MTNKEIIKLIEESKFIAIVRGVPVEKYLPLVEAFYKGGIRAVEFPFSQRDPEANEEMLKGLSTVVAKMGDKMAFGCGTVCTKEQLKKAYKAGAKLIIAPHTDIKLIKMTKRLKLISIPGCQTASEMQAAYLAGADFVKFFPGFLATPKFIKEVLYPLPYLKILVFGGVTPENSKDIFAAGAAGAGIQGGILKMDLINKGDFESITELCKGYTEKHE